MIQGIDLSPDVVFLDDVDLKDTTHVLKYMFRMRNNSMKLMDEMNTM